MGAAGATSIRSLTASTSRARRSKRWTSTYGRLAAEVVGRDGFSRRWDAIAQAPFLWNADRRIFISYDDPESMRLKASYVRGKGLGGVMFWQYAEDPSGALLDALAHDAQSRTVICRASAEALPTSQPVNHSGAWL